MGFVAFGCLAAAACASPAPVAARPAPAPVAAAAPQPAAEPSLAARKGWGYLVERLVADGLPRDRVERAFGDPRIDAFDELLFRVEPRESHALYRDVLRPKSVAMARECFTENADAFELAEIEHGVDAPVVAAILHVETRCGRNTGSRPILTGLARLAMANEPDNVERNVQRTAVADGVLDEALAARVRARAAKLEEMFYPEVRATFEVADREGVDVPDLVGSGAGAFGLPQFLPTSYLRFGADGDGDGRVDLYDLRDAAASAARFLAASGWKPGLSREEQQQVIWHYNRSDAYIASVLGLADRIAPARPPATRTAASAPAARPTTPPTDDAL